MSQALHVHLTEEDRSHLDSLIKKGVCSARVQNRARILLLADRGTFADGKARTRQQISDATLTCLPTVCRICRVYATEGLQAALCEKPRPGKAPKLSGEAEAHLIATACSEPPDGQTRWTLKLLRNKLIAEGHVQEISEVALHKRLKKTRSSRGR
jgi:hypothetical protein